MQFYRSLVPKSIPIITEIGQCVINNPEMHLGHIEQNIALILTKLFSFYEMPIVDRHLHAKSSAVMKTCRVCSKTKHLSSFTKTVLNYCHSICNSCSSEMMERFLSRIIVFL